MLKQYIAVVLVLILAVPALADTGRIHGAVIDSEGNPVAGARVELHREIAGYELTSFTTHMGEYAFNDVPPGVFAVDVTLKGVFLGEDRVEMMMPVERHVDFTVDADLVRSVGD